jgi:hypothetical protein
MSGRQRQEAVGRVQVYSDPLQHVLIAAVVTAPLVARGGRRVLATAATAALVIDVDHAIAARSVRVRDTTSLGLRPRSHSLVTAALAGSLVAAAAGPLHGWAAFSALGSHLLHDAGDRAAPTPVLWPWRPARQLGRRVQLAGTLLLTTGSAIVAACAGGGSGAASPQTASGRS